MRERDRGQATLTRGGSHACRPELPQDEALLALGQRQEEFVGFYALLAETEHRQLSSGWARTAAPSRSAVPAGSSPASCQSPGVPCYAVPLPSNFKPGSRKTEDTIHVGEARWLPFG